MGSYKQMIWGSGFGFKAAGTCCLMCFPFWGVFDSAFQVKDPAYVLNPGMGGGNTPRTSAQESKPWGTGTLPA